MDHSLQSYIERFPSEALLSFLELCLYRGQLAQYAQAVPLIFATLQQRNVPIPERMRSEWDKLDIKD